MRAPATGRLAVMARGKMRWGHEERGSASVELVAVVPFLVLALAVAAQIALAGQALWSAGVAARAGARAALVGGSAEAVAKRTLPKPIRDRAEVAVGAGVTVRLPVVRLLPAMPELRVEASSELDGGDG